jgi:hypothetical protein
MHRAPPAIQPRSNLKWAAIDLDGTLAEGIWTHDDPTAEIGPPILANVYKLRWLLDLGWKIHIHTARPWHDYERIETWLVFWQIPYHAIHCGKILAGIYVDDRAVHADKEFWSTEARV